MKFYVTQIKDRGFMIKNRRLIGKYKDCKLAYHYHFEECKHCGERHDPLDIKRCETSRKPFKYGDKVQFIKVVPVTFMVGDCKKSNIAGSGWEVRLAGEQEYIDSSYYKKADIKS